MKAKEALELTYSYRPLGEEEIFNRILDRIRILATAGEKCMVVDLEFMSKGASVYEDSIMNKLKELDYKVSRDSWWEFGDKGFNVSWEENV